MFIPEQHWKKRIQRHYERRACGFAGGTIPAENEALQLPARNVSCYTICLSKSSNLCWSQVFSFKLPLDPWAVPSR